MHTESTRNIFDTFPFLNFLSAIMCVFPTSRYLKNGEFRGKCNNFSRYWGTLFSTVVYTFCLVAANVRENIFESKKHYDFNKIAYLLYIATIVTVITTTYVQYILSVFGTPYIVHMSEMVRRSDNLMIKTGYKFDYNSAFMIKFLTITFGMYFITVNLSLEVWNSSRENMGNYAISEFVVVSWPQFLIHFAESRFVLGNLLHYTRFFAVNMILESLYKKNGGRNFLMDPQYNDFGFLGKLYSFVKKPDVSDEYVLYCAMKSHYTMYRITLIWNNVFGVIIMFSALIQFTSIAFAICFCYYNINNKPVATVIWILWALLRLYELLRKTYIAHLVQSEANMCIHFVDKLLLLQWNVKMARRLNIFSLQLNQCRVKYTACGLFEVDATLIFTIIASATMYLIVTYQFQQGQNNDCGNDTISTTLSGMI